MILNPKTLKPGRTSIEVALEDMNEEARYPLSLEQAATLAWLYNVGHFASDCLQAVKAHLQLHSRLWTAPHLKNYLQQSEVVIGYLESL